MTFLSVVDSKGLSLHPSPSVQQEERALGSRRPGPGLAWELWPWTGHFPVLCWLPHWVLALQSSSSPNLGWVLLHEPSKTRAEELGSCLHVPRRSQRSAKGQEGLLRLCGPQRQRELLKQPPPTPIIPPLASRATWAASSVLYLRGHV